MLGLRKTSSLYVVSITFFMLWTLLICILSYYDIAAEKKKTIAIAKKESQTTSAVAMALRHWTAKQGGIYAQISEHIQPSPYLEHIPDRDIATSTGKQLTLMNPAYVFRQVMEDYAIQYQTKAHLTSLKTLNPVNDPDVWERDSLKKIEDGRSEVFDLVNIEEEPFLRLLRPLLTKKECLACHAAQGYKVGDIRGAMSISLPLRPYLLSEKQSIRRDMATHLAFWLVGSLALLIITFWGRRKILDHHLVEETLRKKALDFQSIFGNSPVPMVIVDKQNDIVSHNKKFTQMFGYTLEDISTSEKWWNNAYPDPSYRAKVKAGWKEAIAKAEASGDEIETQVGDLTCKNGLRRTVEFNLMPLEEMSVISMNDITDRKIIEEALIAEKNKLEAVISSLGDGLTVQDRSFRIIYQNEIQKERQGDHEGEYCYKAYQGRDTICDGCSVAQCFADGQLHKRETSSVSTDGKDIFMEVSASPVKDSKGNIIGAVETVRDITPRKLLEKQLKHSQKMEAIGTLAGGIAHDFNNLLTIIMGYTNLIKDDVGPDSPTSSSVDAVIEAGSRAVEMVEQILTFSRQTEHKIGPVQIDHVVKETLKLLCSSLPSTIEVKQEIDSESGFIESDAGKINQIVMNLCTNAYHAMQKSGGILTVSLQPIQVNYDDEIQRELFDFIPGAYVELTVIDNGPGIEKANLERIFDPYFSTKGKGEGTGLGLSVVHGIVKGHDGHISVTSEPGVGTKFQVYLPQMTEKALLKAKENIEEAAVVPLKGSERIMVVDDENRLATLVKMILEAQGYGAEAFFDSNEALQAFKKMPADFDLIITDMTMPGMNGLELSEEICKIRPDIPIILCTGFSELVDQEETMQSGIRKLLTKPVGKEELAKAIRGILD